jgi:hypothetical protein
VRARPGGVAVIIAVWLIAIVGLALWSVTAWGMQALLTVDPAHIGDMTALIDKVPYAEWLSRWLPGWQEGLHLAAEILQGVLGWVGGVAPVLLWILWAIGATVLLGAAALLSLLITLLRSNRALPSPRTPVQPG